MDQTVYATEIDEGTIGGDTLDDTLEDLTLLALGDDLLLRCV